MDTLSILIVDDDRIVRDLLGQICTRLGTRCYSTASLKDARRTLSTEHIDLAIIDGLLPDGNGMKFVEELSSKGQLEGSILFLSAFYKDLRSYQTLKKLGVAKVLHKPISPEVLEIEIDQLLRPKRALVAAALPAKVTTDIKEELKELSASYRAGLPIEEQALVSLLSRPETELEATNTRAKIRSIVHGMAGVAGMCGFPDLSAKASDIDHKIDAGSSIDSLRGDFAQLFLEIRLAGGELSNQNALPEAEIVGECDGAAGYVSGILFVGDAAQGEHISGYARSAHLDLRWAPNFRDAVEVLQGAQPDAVVVDADSTGFEALGEFVSSVRNQLGDAVPVACLSASNTISSRIQAQSAGVQLYYSKPIEFAAVHRGINEKLATQGKTGSILIVDDDPTVGAFARRVLERTGVTVRSVENPEHYWDELENEKPTMILLDVCLPIYSGYELCAVTKADPRYRDIPVIISSVRSEASARTAAFKAGADEYLIKPLLAEEFKARVLSRLRTVLSSQQVSYHDRLTGLLSRGAMEDILQRSLTQVERESRGAPAARKQRAVILFDIDDFKSLNDTAGHLVGDQALRMVAQAFQQALRSTDYVARWGGEEFLVLLDDATPVLCRQVFSRVLASLARNPIKAGSFERQITLSAGAAMLTVGESVANTIDRADASLYQAKRDGKKRIVMASSMVSTLAVAAGRQPMATC